MELVIGPTGRVHCLYGEAIDLGALGTLRIVRASHVEPDEEGCWWADLAPVAGPRLGPFTRRSDALTAERAWLTTNWLGASPCAVPCSIRDSEPEIHPAERTG